jgi:hypothetical protein
MRASKSQNPPVYNVDKLKSLLIARKVGATILKLTIAHVVLIKLGAQA